MPGLRRGNGPGPREPGPTWARKLLLDFDATITIAHSEKENAAATCGDLEEDLRVPPVVVLLGPSRHRRR
jgi:hypothetical protein